uniref:Uncharacterized protein n=1 Tax=Kalanchoe fedtschenkoi TaxID=63787 RepID=A0A7N0RIR2_KALFE
MAEGDGRQLSILKVTWSAIVTVTCFSLRLKEGEGDGDRLHDDQSHYHQGHPSSCP